MPRFGGHGFIQIIESKLLAGFGRIPLGVCEYFKTGMLDHVQDEEIASSYGQ
jgi:hypothetical protein